MNICSLTHSPAHSLIHSLTHPLAHLLSFTHLLAHSFPTHPFTHSLSLTHSLAPLINICSLTHSSAHSLIHSVTHPLAHSLSQYPVTELDHIKEHTNALHFDFNNYWHPPTLCFTSIPDRIPDNLRADRITLSSLPPLCWHRLTLPSSSSIKSD